MFFEISNFILYGGLLYFFFKKRSTLILLYIIAIWAFSAFLGIFYPQTEVYREGMFELSFMPFLFLFICFVISLYPLINQRYEINYVYYGNIKYLNIFSWFIIIISFFPFIELLYRLFSLVSSGQFLYLGAIYKDVAEGKEESLVQLSLTSTRLATLVKSFKVLSVILFFYYLQKEKINKILVFGLLISSFTPSLFTLSIGGKTNLIYYLLYIVGMYLFLKQSLAPKNKKMIKKIIVSIILIITLLTVVLSIGRYVIGTNDNNTDYKMFLFQYSAESMYNFNENVFHTNKYLDGYYTSLPLFQDLGLTDITIAERRDYFSSKVTFPVQLFYTFIGMFYADFGLLGCISILIILSFTFNKIKKGYQITLPRLVLLSTYLYMLIQGLFYYCYSTSYAPIYANLIFYFIASMLNRKNGNRNELKTYRSHTSTSVLPISRK